MQAPRASRVIALAVVALFVVSAFAVAGTASIGAIPSNNSVSSAAAVPAATIATPTTAAPASTAAAASTASATSNNIAANMAASAAAATKAAGINPRYEFPPRPSATATQVAATKAQGHVEPLYSGTPAPLGLGYYGYQANATGGVVPTILNTSSVQGYVDASDIAASDLFQSSPDSYGIQLNSVTTNVTLFGTGGYSFWTQNVVEYYPTAGFLVLVTNVWNFSGGPLSSNVFYSHGPYGVQVGTEYYYSEIEIPANIQYPWNLTLTMTSNLTMGRDSVYFTVGFTGPTVPGYLNSLTYDWVVFNSTVGAPLGSVLASPYTANGFDYNPVGLTDDFELIFGGPGGGSHSDLTAADATLGLAYWDGTAYVAVPSALSYGGETGETTTGASIAWSNAALGPNNLSTYGVMTTGPAILHGLWNGTTPEGADAVTVAATPANAFTFVTPAGASTNFTINETQYAPTIFDNTFDLSPGNYTLLTELSGWVAQTTAIDVTGPQTVVVTLSAQLTPTVYTPLWAIGNSELAAISSGGAGTPSSPYLLLNDQSAPFSSLFGQYNDYAFPVFPGIFLQGTTASVEILNAPSLTATTSTYSFPGQYLPTTNTLQQWYWNVSNVSIAHSTISGGWFMADDYYPAVFDTFNVIFYASTGNLVYNNTFDSAAQGLLLFQGGQLFGPSTGGGGTNVVFGNTFTTIAAPECPTYPVCEPLVGYGQGLGLELAEGNDTIFNNAFATPTTAWELPINLYSGFPQYFNTTAWNVTPGSHPSALADFPQFDLNTKNILGGSALGGNYWWDYGYPLNPFNGAVNPASGSYVENATTLLAYVYGCDPYYCATYLYHGGDLAPLSAEDQFQVVTVREVGPPAGAAWGAYFESPVPFPAPLLFAESYVGGYSQTLVIPNGTYVPTPIYAGQTIVRPSTVVVGIAHTGGPGQTATLVFGLSPTYGYLSFHETGLPLGDTFAVAVYPTGHPLEAVEQTTETNLLVFLVPRGSTSYFVFNTTDGYTPKVPAGTLVLGASASVHVKFEVVTWPIVIVESGLPSGTHWSVQLTPYVPGHVRKITVAGTTSTLTSLQPNATYGVTVKPLKGYYMYVSGLTLGNVTVNGSGVEVLVFFTQAKYFVTFSETGLPFGTGWSVSINSNTVTGNYSTISVEEPNGTYAYTIGAVAGYSSSSHPAAVHVSGHSVTIYVTFRATDAVRQLPISHAASGTVPVVAAQRS